MINITRTNSFHRGSTPLQIIATLAFLLSSAGVVQAQDWGFDPIIKIAGEYDDNAELNIRTDQEIALEGFLLEASARMDYSSPRTTFSVTPRILSRQYSDDPIFDSDDFYVRSTYNHQMRSSSIGFRLNFDDQTVRTGERADTDFDIEDPDEITNNDSGRVAIQGERTRWRLKPNWSYRFSDIASIAADVDYFTVDYEDVFLNQLSDFDDTRLNFSYRHAFSNLNTGILTATGRRFETADGLSEVTGYGLMVGFDRSLSQTTQLRAQVGFESTDQGASASEDDTNAVGDITLIRNLETIRMLAQYRRTITGTGRGRLSTRESVNLNFTRQLNQRVSAGMGIRAYQSSGLDDPAGTSDRDYVQLRSQFIWYLSQAFSLEFDYRFTMLNRENVGERANSNQVNVWFVYQPNRESI